MFKASKSDLFELYVEVIVEGDCVTRTQCFLQLVGRYHSLADLNEAAAEVTRNGGYCIEFRYPEAFARVYNTLRKREVERMNAWYDATEVPF